MSIFDGFSKIFNQKNQLKISLFVLNFFLALTLIFLGNAKILPLDAGNFVFFFSLFLAFSLFRPGWFFLLFSGMIMFENVSLSPAEFGFFLRPYQFLGFLIILALTIRSFSSRLNFKFPKISWVDRLVVAISFFGFFAILNAPDKMLSLKLAIVFVSFSVLYFLTRYYLQTFSDIKKIIPFFLASSLIDAFYGIWQSFRFQNGMEGFEVMEERINLTFMEPDWAGIFLVVLATVFLALQYLYFNFACADFFPKFQEEEKWKMFSFKNKFFFVFWGLVFSFMAIFLTVSRSAWLAIFVVIFFFLFILLTNLNFRAWHWKFFSKNFFFTLSAGFLALGLIYIFNLTDFELKDRLQSVGTGKQKITVSCRSKIENDLTIGDVSDLEKMNCRHIDLEDISAQKSTGFFVTEVYRDDPNVKTRNEIYQKSWKEIKKHYLLGIGWGSIGKILGKDLQGNFFNSSNIFLEVWLSAGIVGFLSLVFLFFYIFWKALKKYYFSQNFSEKAFFLFCILSWFAIFVFNFFNAGIFLGFFWFWLAIVQIKD